ncbi:3-hydroxyacyl-CoA dehydrogenase [Sphingobium sp. AS12]|uniref:3-hydroxyacyl-CoA dehydrogenase n=1 Tax=Sphingobium sp. AS12 TaxID=2849495 RepID=UPI001C31C59F|nr:3-hydroxyacyl-CoA dehydrogenase [Sphingobium sp. AS12]MBV2148103.1 3-hydroxyacyl-CoA dehydrogenase [Sphingobium sp. AS12]
MSEVNILGVVGAGPMGAGIAQIGLTSGLDVILFDLSPDARAKAGKDIKGRITRLVEKGMLPDGSTETMMARLTLASDLAAFAPAQAVVEAIIERLEPKQKLFADLEAIVAPDAILATNTSSLSVAAIAAHCTHKERVCGLHFFNPVPLMKLVEVITAPGTSAAIAERATALSKAIDKVPVTVKDGPGFLVNLQGRAYAQEGLAIVQEGVAEPVVIDRIMRDAAGFRMGPFELMDLTGIDVNYAASTYIYEGYQHDPRLKTTTLHALMAAAGRFGRKTGQGFFSYAAEAIGFPASPEATASPPEIKPALGEAAPEFEALAERAGWEQGNDVTLIAPIGEDCATACARLGLDPNTTVAIDFTAFAADHLTVMAAVGGRSTAESVADWLRSKGLWVEVIGDSPGFVLQRMLAMVANLGCELAQIGVGTPRDIDIAMKLAQNYPKGPIEWGEWLGIAKTHLIMQQLQAITGSDRYRPSLWLRRRAQLGLSLYEVG